MYIVRWLMGHPIIATWALGIIAILLSISGTSKNGHEEEVDSHAAKSTEVVDGATHVATTTTSGGQHSLDKATISSASSKKEEKHETIAASSEESATTTAVVITDVKKKVDQVTVVPVEASPSVKVEMQTTTQAGSVSTAKVVVPSEGSDIGQMNADEILLMAREAYWNNGLDEAAGLYTQLIKLQPNIMEYKGELGNVYWRQGNSKKAAELYSEIAIPMLQKGDIKRVANMVGFIGLFYPNRAKKIHQKVMLMQQGQ